MPPVPEIENGRMLRAHEAQTSSPPGELRVEDGDSARITQRVRGRAGTRQVSLKSGCSSEPQSDVDPRPVAGEGVSYGKCHAYTDVETRVQRSTRYPDSTTINILLVFSFKLTPAPNFFLELLEQIPVHA